MKPLESYFKAGEIASEAKRLALNIIREGASVLEICERIEEFIRSRGGEPAFPCNVCINEVAAHYTAKPNDQFKVPMGSLVKIDLGVHVDGYPVDTAVTVVFDDRLLLLKEAAEEALRRVLKTLSAGVRLSEIGRVVFETAKSYGLKPIKNLSGHEIARFNLHAGLSIPNVPSLGGKVRLNGIYAIEPFMTEADAKGLVIESRESTIYRCLSYKRLKDKSMDSLLKAIWLRFKGLPFTERWFKLMRLKADTVKAWSRVRRLRMIKGYRVLREVSGGFVAQAEETVLVTEDGCVGLTGFLKDLS